MYFLAKNIRTCSKPFRGTPDGVLNWQYLAKNVCFFMVHPEQIKQKLKEKDAHLLCQFFDSEEYKKRVTQFLETQGKILAKDTGVKPSGSVKYQHVLSCAQPSHKKTLAEDENETETSKAFASKKKRVKRGTIFEEIIKKKSGVAVCTEPDCANIKSEMKPKKVRQRSTIMPIFLKKIKHRRMVGEQDYEEKESQGPPDYQTARRIESSSDEVSEPLYAQILHKSNIYRRKPVQKFSFNCNTLANTEPPKKADSPGRLTEKAVDKAMKLESVCPPSKSKVEPMEKVPYELSVRRNTFEMVDSPHNQNSSYNLASKLKVDNSGYKLSKREEIPLKLGGNTGVIPLRMASSTAKFTTKTPTVTLYPRKNMNLKSYSEFLHSVCVKPKKEKRRVKSAKETDDETIKIEVLGKGTQSKKAKKANNKNVLMQMIIDQVQQSRSLKSPEFENTLEKKSTMMQVIKNRQGKKNKKKKSEQELTSLFKKVKMGSSKNVTSSTSRSNRSSSAKAVLKPVIAETARDQQESFTYKIVSKNRERREAQLKKNFKVNPPYWQGKFSFDFVQPGGEASQEARDSRIISKTIPTNLHRPTPHFIEHANKPKILEVNQYHGYHKYSPGDFDI